MSIPRTLSMNVLFPLTLAGVLLALLPGVGAQLAALRPPGAAKRAPLYLPTADRVRLTTLGFDAFAADLLWFDTVNYFGKEFHQNGRFEWFAHRCRLVTELHPKSLERFEFCATLLSWIAKDPRSSNEILTRAHQHFPGDWHVLYLRSFNSWYFLNDAAGAAEDLRIAATMDGAPPLIASLASRLLTSATDPNVVVDFLTDSVRRTADPNARAALEERLRQARLTRDLYYLNRAVAEFAARLGRPPSSFDELIATGLLRQLPAEPFGGAYQLSGDRVVSSSGARGLTFDAHTPHSEESKKPVELTR